MLPDDSIQRREFLRVAGGGVAIASASGTATAQQGGKTNGAPTEPIDYGGYLEGVNGWGGAGSTVDKTGTKEVHIKVGVGPQQISFTPVAVHVSPGTTIIWKWYGSKVHNVHAKTGAFKSKIKGSGTFTYTVKKQGIVPYWCDPHKGLGMKGALAVGSVPHKAPVTPATPAVSQQAKTLAVATFVSMVSTLSLAYFFIKYGGDYER